MPRTVGLSLVLLVATSTAFAEIGSPERHVSFGEVAVYGSLPVDLLDPEGKSRWDLTAVEIIETSERRVSSATTGGARGWEQLDGTGPSASVLRWTDPVGGDAVERWILPHRYGETLQPGSKRILEIVESRGGASQRLRIDVETVGIGWVHLPGRPYEVALQRVLVLRELPSGRGFSPDSLVHRWVDPRSGVVAEISGPASPDGRERTGVDNVIVVREIFAGADPMRIYLPEIDQGLYGTLTVRRDQENVAAISDVTANPGVTDIMSLVNQGTWDFNVAATRAGAPAAQSRVQLDAFETCNVYQCGYFPGRRLGRRDSNFGSTSLVTNNQIEEVELGDTANPATDPTLIYLRAGRQREGVEGAFGSGESGFCYEDQYVCAGDSAIYCRDAQDCIDAGTTGPCNFSEDLTESPLWVFPHYDGTRSEWYLENGDAGWSSGVLGCEQNLFNRVCGGSGVFDRLWSKDCSGHAGTQSGEILTEGVATLPSGHTVNALVVRTVADFCVYLNAACSSIFQVDEVRTAVYLWQVPHFNTVALLQSEQNTPNIETFTSLDQATFAVGLFPPVTITAGGETETTIDVSWDPGNDLLGIEEFVVYWDTDSGAVSDYDNSMVVPSSQTSATIGGLDPSTQHFITVTARADYSPFPPAPFCRRDYATACASDADCGSLGPCVLTDPPTTMYESIRFPTQVSGDPDHIYPVEVQVTTVGDCIPAQEVENLMVGKDGDNQQFCWDASADACTIGHDLLWSATAEGNFTVTAQTGLETCWTGNPPFGYFKVVARGTGGSGP